MISKIYKSTISFLLTLSLIVGGISILKVSADSTTVQPDVVVTKISDGSTPFDIVAANGNDISNNNNLVRNGDVTNYQFDFSLNDPAGGVQLPYSNYTMTTQPLPVGLRWQALPAGCTGTGSMLTGDGLTAATKSIMICNIGSFTAGNASQINASVTTLPIAPSGTQFNANAVVKIDGSANTGTNIGNPNDTTLNPLVTTTSSLKVDLVKTASNPYNGAKVIDGQLGFLFAHGLGIKLKKGSEAPALPMTLTDDISSVSPNAKFVECGVSNAATRWGFNAPWGKLSDNLSTPQQSVVDSGAIACTPSSGNPKIINISITGTDLNPIQYPTIDLLH
jgi:hypothetical protein